MTLHARIRRLATAIVLGLAAVPLLSCDALDALNIFLVKFSYNRYKVSSIQGPALLNDAATVWSGPGTPGYAAALTNVVAHYGLGMLASPTTVMAKIKNEFSNPANYKLATAFVIDADNSGNDDSAAFGLDNKVDFYIQDIDKSSGTPISTKMPAFGVGAGQTTEVEIPLTVSLANLQPEVAQSVLRGDKIPYLLNGTLKFDLKAGDRVIDSRTTSMDLVTDSIPTRTEGDGDQVQEFLKEMATLVN